MDASNPIPYDWRQALSSDWRTYLFDHRQSFFVVPCIEGDLVIKGNWLLINVVMCMPLIKRLQPISRDKHLMLSGIYDSSAHRKCLTQVSRSLEEAGYSREDLGHDIIMTINNMFNLCYSHLGGYIRTMDIFAIAETILQPEAKAICTMDYGDVNDKKIKRMQVDLKNQNKKVDQLLSGDSLAFNIFRAPLLCGALKKGQFFQFVTSAGPRSDTDDQMFLRPVIGSFLSGFKDIRDLAFESRSASKSTHYNKTQMSQVQYGNRKIHIQASAIERLYPGDCGSTVYLDYPVPDDPEIVRLFIGKYFLNEAGQLVELTEERFPQVQGKMTQFRDVWACRHTKGYCEVCGGTITRSFSRNGNIGFLSNVNTGAPVAQQVLSTKHLTTTDAAEYLIPHNLQNLLMSDTNDVYLRPNIRKRIDVLALGFQPKDLARVNDLKKLGLDDDVNASLFSDIKYLSVGTLSDKDGSITRHSTRVAMGGETKSYPYLSPEVLGVIREHPEDIVMQGGIAWLLLRHINPELPIMQCAVVNRSIKLFVNRFTDLITNRVADYTSMNDFILHLTKLIWEKTNPHITHVSCLARSCLITSNGDFHIPVVNDPNNVKFGRLLRIIPNRAIGGVFAFEKINLITKRPSTFITNRRSSSFDAFMGYEDDIQAQMNVPVRTGSPVEIERPTLMIED